jgi:monofunctional biosynthetic peptidoglycan transglycosylase
MADGKGRKTPAVAPVIGVLCLAFVAWLLAIWPLPIWWRAHWPRQTAMMRIRAQEHPGRPVGQLRQTPLDQISPALQRMVIIGEDSRFWTHHGIDPVEIRDALGLDESNGVVRTAWMLWRRRNHVRGASTITQQLAKNLYLSPSRSVLRKIKEAVTAFEIELMLPKRRILELYLNVAEWGPGVWGAEAASQVYFRVPASRLTDEQAAALAATLPHPRTSNPRVNPERMQARKQVILARYRGADVRVTLEADSLEDSLEARRIDVQWDVGDSIQDLPPNNH